MFKLLYFYFFYFAETSQQRKSISSKPCAMVEQPSEFETKGPPGKCNVSNRTATGFATFGSACTFLLGAAKHAEYE